MLERVITNAIETPNGYKNAVHGIALRGPLSQFFSAIYLKPLDDAFDAMNVTYVRYQDDILILCKTKRQLNRCKRRMMEILHERRLGLSRKKSRMGCIQKGFHFLGINYPGTQTQDNITVAHSNDDQASAAAGFIAFRGVEPITDHLQNEFIRIAPHPRTLRKAREQVKLMVLDGISAHRIRSYLRRWAMWWVLTVESWQYKQLLIGFSDLCWDVDAKSHAADLLLEITERVAVSTLNPVSQVAA
jgi:RNA-directed DNA polymerase